MGKFGWSLPPGCSMRDIGKEWNTNSLAIVEIVDNLANDRAYARLLLQQAFNRMPPDPVLTCTCTPKEEYSWCELHDGTGEPTLRQEIETYLKEIKK